MAAKIVALSIHVLPQDARILITVYQDGMPLKDIAVLLGVDLRALQRRVQALSHRVTSPEFAFVLLHIQNFDPDTALVARACVLHGLSMRTAADELGISVHAVRRSRALVLAMTRGAVCAGEDLRVLRARNTNHSPSVAPLSPGGFDAQVSTARTPDRQSPRSQGDDRWTTRAPSCPRQQLADRASPSARWSPTELRHRSLPSG